MSNKKSNWREQSLSLYESFLAVSFKDTEPNYIYITNNGDTNLYIKSTANVSETAYNLIVPPQGRKLFARPNPFNEVYVYGTVGTPFVVESFASAFDPANLDQTTETMTLGQFNGEVAVTSLPSLPAGGNKLGSVSIDGGVVLNGSNLPDSSALPMRTAAINDFKYGGLIVGSSATLAAVGTSAFPNRKQLTIYPPEQGRIFWGKQGVTPTTGLPLTSLDAPLSLPVSPLTPAIYLVSEGSVTVQVLEVS